MKKLATYTMALILATIFLLSFTGIRMLIHHCLSCDTTDTFLFAYASKDCDDIHHNHHEQNEAATCHINLDLDLDHDEAITCCAGEDEHDHNSCKNCCETEIHYLKNDYEFLQERSEPRIEPVFTAIFVNLFLFVERDDPAIFQQNSQVANSGPPKPVGRDFVIFAHHFKIA